MKKRLLTFLGNPKKTNETKHEYEKTLYFLPDHPEVICSTSHIFEAILKLTGEHFDQVDIIGTAGSQWDSLLLYLQDDFGWGMIEKVTKDQNIDKNLQAIEYMERELEKSILNGVQCKIHM